LTATVGVAFTFQSAKTTRRRNINLESKHSLVIGDNKVLTSYPSCSRLLLRVN